jgi:hypothetical protein
MEGNCIKLRLLIEIKTFLSLIHRVMPKNFTTGDTKAIHFTTGDTKAIHTLSGLARI